MTAGALDGIRVVDLDGPLGNYCGKLLADLGADVVLVEPDGGSSRRALPPLTDDGESLEFTYQNANKRGAILDPAALADLIRRSDVLIGNGHAAWPDDWGLDLADLVATAPQLVITSITPFGLDGPLAACEGSDLVALAAGGLLAIGGYPDKPVRPAGDQALTAGAAFGAVGTLLAVLDAERSGIGQIVDVSLQESVAMGLEHAAQYYDLEGTVRGRPVGPQRGAGAGLYSCRDGWIYLFVGGIASGRFWTRFLDWLEEEGADGVDDLRTPEWDERAYFDTPGARETFARIFERFTATRGKEELTRGGQARGFAIAPVRTPREVVEGPQIVSRAFFTELRTPGDRRIEAPGAPYTLHATPWRQRRRAPRAGEHTTEVTDA